MSIDVNNYVEAALVGIKEQIDEAHDFMSRIWEAGPMSASCQSMEQLERLLWTACDSLEIFNNYDGSYDRFVRHCWGNHPADYEVQCRLCKVQRLCFQETSNRNASKDLED